MALPLLLRGDFNKSRHPEDCDVCRDRFRFQIDSAGSVARVLKLRVDHLSLSDRGGVIVWYSLQQR
jgi:hypothetical protein